MDECMEKWYTEAMGINDMRGPGGSDNNSDIIHRIRESQKTHNDRRPTPDDREPQGKERESRGDASLISDEQVLSQIRVLVAGDEQQIYGEDKAKVWSKVNAIESLQALLEHTSETVRIAAQKALEQIEKE